MVLNKTKKTIESYDLHADEYQIEADERGIRKDDVKTIFSYLNGINNPTVVELGCAHGRDAKEIVKYTNKYFGMDASKNLIERAKRILPNINFQVSTFDEYKFPNKVDAVVAFASLLHANKKTMKTVLRNAFNVLNPGGIIFLSLQKGRYQLKTKIDDMGVRNFYYYTPEEIEKIVPYMRVVYQKIQNLRYKNWFIMVLQKQKKQ